MLGVMVELITALLPSTLIMRYRLREESKKKLTLIAFVLAVIQVRFVFGSMWNTCALQVKIGCSLEKSKVAQQGFSKRRNM